MFGRKKSFEDILKEIDGLDDEEKAKLKAKLQDLYKAEDEREIDKIEEDKADDAETKAKKAEEVKEESEEIGEDVDEIKDEVTEDETAPEGEFEEVAETEEEAVEEESSDDEDKFDKLMEVVDALSRKLDHFIEKSNTEKEPFGLDGKATNEEVYKPSTSAEERKKYFGW